MERKERRRADLEGTEYKSGTTLRYVAKAEIGGKLAQLGSRLVMSNAKKLSKNFFEKFDEVVTAEHAKSLGLNAEEKPDESASDEKKGL